MGACGGFALPFRRRLRAKMMASSNGRYCPALAPGAEALLVMSGPSLSSREVMLACGSTFSKSPYGGSGSPPYTTHFPLATTLFAVASGSESFNEYAPWLAATLRAQALRVAWLNLSFGRLPAPHQPRPHRRRALRSDRGQLVNPVGPTQPRNTLLRALVRCGADEPTKEGAGSVGLPRAVLLALPVNEEMLHFSQTQARPGYHDHT